MYMRNRGQFPFLDLPDIVRQNVYDHLVEPIGGWIEVSDSLENTRDGNDRRGYCIKVFGGEFDGSGDDAEIVKFRQCVHSCGAPSAYQAIAYMAAVNHQIRSELGHAFWKGRNLWATYDSVGLINFLQERPAVHQSIKTLWMKCNFWNNAHEVDPPLTTLTYLADHLNLDRLEICVYASVNTARELEKLSKSLPWPQGIKKIPTKAIVVYVHLFDWDDVYIELGDDGRPDSDKMLENRQRTQREIGLRFEKLLLHQPRTSKTSEEALYLEARSNSLNGPADQD